MKLRTSSKIPKHLFSYELYINQFLVLNMDSLHENTHTLFLTDIDHVKCFVPKVIFSSCLISNVEACVHATLRDLI